MHFRPVLKTEGFTGVGYAVVYQGEFSAYALSMEFPIPLCEHDKPLALACDMQLTFHGVSSSFVRIGLFLLRNGT